MSKTSVIPTDFFNKRAKPYIKKYRTLQKEINALAEEIQENPFLGTDLGDGIRKIRLASKSARERAKVAVLE